MKKNDFFGLLAFICLMFVSTVVNAQTIAVEPADRTEGQGGTITNLAELRWLSENDVAWSEEWVLSADIDATETKDWNGGEGFSPIGNSTTAFEGIFDGGQFEITGIYINRPSLDAVGFFGVITGLTTTEIIDNGDGTSSMETTIVKAEVYNLGINNITVIGNGDVNNGIGGFAALIKDATITSCFVSGGSVKAADETVAVTAGGFVARTKNNTEITNCYASSEVRGRYVGGFMGAGQGGGTCTLNSCYAASYVSGYQTLSGSTMRGPTLGSFTAMEQGTEYLNCYSDNELTSGIKEIAVKSPTSTAVVTGLTTTEFGIESNFTDWIFDIGNWVMKSLGGVTRPYFDWSTVEPSYPTDIEGEVRVDSNVSISPNPATTFINVNANASQVNVQIFSLSGQKVMERNVQGNNTLDISSLNSGVYIIRANNYTQKLIVK